VGSRSLEILIVLVESAGNVVGKNELVARVWPDVSVEESSLRVHIARLRKALADGRDGARYINTIPGRGYCFVAPVSRAGVPQLEPAAPPGSAAFATTGLDRHSRLPDRLARMVGRDATLLDLSKQLLSTRFITIVGPGGLGKTTLAVSIAHALAEQFAGAVRFIDLAPVVDPTLIVGSVSAAFGLLSRDDTALRALLGFLERERILLVLDNCEHVIDSVAALAEQISGRPHEPTYWPRAANRCASQANMFISSRRSRPLPSTPVCPRPRRSNFRL